MLQGDLYCPRPGHSNFEVTLHNRDVRSLLKDNGHHSLYADLWADDQRTIVEARDAGEAHAIAARRYPPEMGFVISRVTMVERGRPPG